MDQQIAELIKQFVVKSAQAMQLAHAMVSAPRKNAEAVADELIKLGYIEPEERAEAIEVLSSPNGALEVLKGVARLRKKAEGDFGKPYRPERKETRKHLGSFPTAIGDDYRANLLATETVARRLGLI